MTVKRTGGSKWKDQKCEGEILMENLIKQAELLKMLIRNESKNIDNPILTTTVIIELDNLIEFLQDEE